ncbi:DinB family protein [uncultured Mucilaginibacter sp.]|uniref:DinB family protein n=1 Tax=uncultured Mucilaginibacter sp. TaxID=797541 RepID=UPI0025E55CAB|nr:DinB family protein [uncultured Mucilaginibacter sp.]
MKSKQPEVWLRGPLDDVPALLQPVAHALLQAREEITDLMNGFPEQALWTKPASLASPAFHLQHLTGVLDRLFTYIRQEQLSQRQLDYLAAEGNPNANSTNVAGLVQSFSNQIDLALVQIKTQDPQTLIEFRGVGRAQLPSTVIGLYTHAAEHTMRHLGQLLVTVGVLRHQA